MISQRIFSLMSPALLALLTSCSVAIPRGAQESQQKAPPSQDANLVEGDGGLLLQQPDLGYAADSKVARFLQIVLRAQGANALVHDQKYPYQAGAAIKIGQIRTGSYSLSVRLLEANSIVLQGDTTVAIAKGQTTSANVGLEEVTANPGTGSLVVTIHKKPSPTNPGSCARAVIDLCQMARPRLCTYVDPLPSGGSKTYQATQSQCGDLVARAQIETELCLAQRPFVASQMVCKDNG